MIPPMTPLLNGWTIPLKQINLTFCRRYRRTRLYRPEIAMSGEALMSTGIGGGKRNF
jgi:hypothetical protein